MIPLMSVGSLPPKSKFPATIELNTETAGTELFDVAKTPPPCVDTKERFAATVTFVRLTTGWGEFVLLAWIAPPKPALLKKKVELTTASWGAAANCWETNNPPPPFPDPSD